MSDKIGIIIPCRNVSSTICALFDSLSSKLLSRIDRILCIDNQSRDNTVSTLLELQSRKNTPYSGKVAIIKNHEDYNYGGSIKIGFQYFIRSNYDWIIILHSDGQIDANSILSTLFEATQGIPAPQVILTSRFLQESDTSKYSRARIIGNLVFNSLTAFTTGLKMSDSGAAISMLRVSLLKDLPFFQITNGLHFHPQLNILIYSDPNIVVSEVPILWRDSDLPSSVRIIKYSLQLIKMLIGYKFNQRIGRSGAALFPFRDENFHPEFDSLPPDHKQ
ncbi:MAG: glycosyltransferase family 2 protein [Verrucomicrobiota bacterium]